MDGNAMNAHRTDDALRVDCNAGTQGHFRGHANSICIKVGQRIRRGVSQEIWDSLTVEGRQEKDGTIVIRVLVFNPEWDEPLQVAALRSRPRDPNSLTALGCNLNHISQ